MVRDSHIDREHYDELQRSLRAAHGLRFHTSFHTYQELHGKGRSTGTQQALWQRMLLCIRGVSAEKAHDIAQQFPTMHHLRAAYKACATQTEAQRLLADTMDATMPLQRRRVGPQLSARIWRAIEGRDAGDDAS